MTLPMLAENYQRIVVQTRLKKFYTTFNQAILRSVDVNGPYQYWWYQAYGTTGGNVDASFDYYIRPYLSVIQSQQVIYTNGTKTTLHYLSDGSAFTYAVNNNYDILFYPKSPVKCLKLPAANRTGVCEFFFNFIADNSANVEGWEPVLGKVLDAYKHHWDGKYSSLFTDPVRGCDDNLSNANLNRYCTAIIQANNWEFPKDYPLKIRY